MASKEQAPQHDKASSRQRSPEPVAESQHPLPGQRVHPAAIIQRVRRDPSSLSPSDVLRVQRTIGNRAALRLLGQTKPQATVQPKLMVGPVGDKYEQEAEEMATQVVRPSSAADETAIKVQPKAKLSPNLRPKSQIQRTDDGSFETDDGFESQLSRSKGGGTPLPNQVRAEMEPRFDADFGQVRVHTDSQAIQMNRDIGAQAFTHGSDVYFGAGKFNPGSNNGKHLLAHELTHTIQQGAVGTTQQVQRISSGVVQRMSKYRFGKGIPQLLAGLVGGVVGAGVGAVAGAGLGGYNAMKATWQGLTKDKKWGHKLYAWLPALIAGVGGVAGGALAGTVAGAGAGARASAWGTGKGVDFVAEKFFGHKEYSSDTLGASTQSEHLNQEFGKSTASTIDQLPDMPTMEPGTGAVMRGSELEVVTKDNGKKTYRADQITELTAYEYTDSDMPTVYVTFYERGGDKKIRPGSRRDFAKAKKYKRGQFVEGHVPKNAVKLRFDTMAVAGLGGSMPAEMNDKIFPVFSSAGPRPQDIAQGLSGQCWLLSPLLAISRRYPEKIRQMIPEIGDRTVTVRFFRNGRPEYVRVTRRFLQVSIMGVKQQISSEKGKQNAVWPILILKAYAAWGGKNSGSRDFTTQSLDGGHGNVAFEAFLGQGVSKDTKGVYTSGATKRPPWQPVRGGGRKWSDLADHLATVGITRQDLLPNGRLNAEFMRWIAYADEHEHDIDEKLNAGAGGRLQPTLDFIYRELAAAKVANSDFGKGVLKAYSPYYGHGGAKKFKRMGIDRYNQAEITFFDRINSTLSGNGLVTAGTTSGRFMKGSGEWGSGRNAILKGGLQQSHAYEVAEVRHDQRTQERYVKLRNPWGHRKMLIVGDAEFELPFSKFLRRFSDVYFNDTPVQVPDQEN